MKISLLILTWTSFCCKALYGFYSQVRRNQLPSACELRSKGITPDKFDSNQFIESMDMNHFSVTISSPSLPEKLKKLSASMTFAALTKFIFTLGSRGFTINKLGSDAWNVLEEGLKSKLNLVYLNFTDGVESLTRGEINEAQSLIDMLIALDKMLIRWSYFDKSTRLWLDHLICHLFRISTKRQATATLIFLGFLKVKFADLSFASKQQILYSLSGIIDISLQSNSIGSVLYALGR